ncbi:MAG: hypothetical protein KAI67_04785 [Candidatus Pacebacteria bacterium]|nr:hypothetical protein [Candidatus Paceibacterota bacterium]
MASEKINKNFILLAIILFAVFAMFFYLICFFARVPEIKNETLVVEENKADIMKSLTVPVDPNVEVESISEEIMESLTVPVDPNIEVESISEEVIKSLTAPK